MGKQEVACNGQFLVLPQCFLHNQKFVYPFVNIFDLVSLFADECQEPKIGMGGKGLTFYQRSQVLITLKNTLLKTIQEKE